MKLDHLVLLVGSLQTSLPFYEALLPLLGFTKSRDHVWGNEDGVYLDLKEATEPGDGYRRYGIGLNHMGFTAPSLEAVQAIADAMRAGGFPLPEEQELVNVRALFMKERDGMRVEISFYG